MKEGYVELNIEQSYYKLTLKASEHILLANTWASNFNYRFVFFLLHQLKLKNVKSYWTTSWIKLLHILHAIIFCRNDNRSDAMQCCFHGLQ